MFLLWGVTFLATDTSLVITGEPVLEPWATIYKVLYVAIGLLLVATSGESRRGWPGRIVAAFAVMLAVRMAMLNIGRPTAIVTYMLLAYIGFGETTLAPRYSESRERCHEEEQQHVDDSKRLAR
jgi:hypothetical protein